MKKGLLGVAILLVGSFFTEAKAEKVTFWGYNVLQCSAAQASSPEAQANGYNQLHVYTTNSFECSYGDRSFELTIVGLSLGLKLGGPNAEYTGFSFSCYQSSDFAGTYNYALIGLGVGYSTARGVAKKLHTEEPARDCVMAINGYEFLQLSAQAGQVRIVELN